MKQILIILGLLASVTTFAQSPRIKLNQITKDSITGSVLISSPTDSGMVYSRDLFISYGADTVLILGGDTLAATSGIISSVLSDGVTITGDGTSGNELKVDTATVIATKQDLDLYYLDSNPDGYTSNTGTVTSVGGTGTVNGISLSGTVTSSGNLTLGGTLSGVDLASQVTGTLPVANGGTGSTTLSGAGIVTGTGTTNYIPKFTSSSAIGNSQIFDNSGNILIGATTNSEGAKLKIEGGYVYLKETDGANVYLRSAYDPNTAAIQVQSASDLAFATNNITRMTLDASGRLGIGTSSPNNLLALYSASSEIYTQWVQSGTGTSSTDGLRIGLDASSNGNINLNEGTALITSVNGSERMRITSSGDVGIGTTSPTSKLQVNGTATVTSLVETSAKRFKENIYNIEDTSIIDKLRPVSFDWKDSKESDYGFIAEEVAELDKLLVTKSGEDDQLQGIKYTKLIPLLVKKIQEQEERIIQLEKNIHK